MYLLDTDHVSELQSNTLSGRLLTARIGQIAPDDYGTTIITFEEQIRGRLAQRLYKKGYSVPPPPITGEPEVTVAAPVPPLLGVRGVSEAFYTVSQVAASERVAPQSVVSYALLNATLLFHYRIAVWQYTEAAARRFGLLREAGIRIGTQDLKIASIARSFGATLLTRNTRDFAKVPDLLMADWTS